MSITLQVFVNLSKLLENQGEGACDAQCVKWMVDLVKQHKPTLLEGADPGNAHTMAVSILALDLAAGALPDDGLGRKRQREINAALALALSTVGEKRMSAGMSDEEVELVKNARVRLGGNAKRMDTPARANAAPDTEALNTSRTSPVGAWTSKTQPIVRDVDAVRDLRIGDRIGEDDMTRMPLPGKDDIRTENLDPSVQAIIGDRPATSRFDWIGLALIALALVIPPMGLFMAGAAWAMEHKGRSMVLSVLAVAGSFAWIMAS